MADSVSDAAPAVTEATVAPAAPPPPCVAAHILGAALFGLGAAAIGVLLATNPELDVFTIAGISISRTALAQAQALLGAGGTAEAIAAFVAQYVC